MSRGPQQAIGGWTLEAPLGRGGFSQVWRAQRGRERAALKLIERAEHAHMLLEEAGALSVVRGPGVVEVREVALDHDPPYLVLQLLEGGSLRAPLGAHGRPGVPDHAIDPGELDRRVLDRLEVFADLLEVLARVHRDGIVHGDLKPENVLFDEAGRVHLADFGLSRRLSARAALLSLSLSGADPALAGTLDYMAPELRAGQAPTPRSDVYAAGALLYELLVGRRPQGALTLPSELHAAVPQSVNELLTGSLAPDPTGRFEHADAMLEALLANRGVPSPVTLEKLPVLELASASARLAGNDGLMWFVLAPYGLCRVTGLLLPQEFSAFGTWSLLGVLLTWVAWRTVQGDWLATVERARERHDRLVLMVAVERAWIDRLRAREDERSPPGGRARGQEGLPDGQPPAQPFASASQIASPISEQRALPPRS